MATKRKNGKRKIKAGISFKKNDVVREVSIKHLALHEHVLHHAKKIVAKVPLTWLIVSIVIIALLFTVLLSLFLIVKDLPTPANLQTNVPQTTKILDRNGKLLYNIYISENRTIIPLSEIPKQMQQATLAIEDKDFYNHGGINLFGGVIRALKENLFSRQLQGGSTITQQLIKTSLLTPERTLRRKLKEIVLAFWTEKIYSKDQILWMYLNRIPYGGTAYGVEEASEFFFGKKANELNLSEIALIAGLPAAPTYYSPFGSNPQRAITRQHSVLDRMVSEKYITKNQAEEAKKTPLVFNQKSLGIKAPHFVAYVKELLVEEYGEKIVATGGLKVTTSLDLELQEATQASLSAEIEKQAKLKVSNGAAIVTKPGTGEVLAMIGSKDYFASNGGTVNVTLAPRSPGSALKPLVYALGFLQGKFTPSTAWADAPYCFPPFNGKTYCPQNYDGKFHGIVQTRYALGGSLNIPAVKALSIVGLENFIATASAMGITTFTDKDRFGYSLALGGGEIKMTDLATAYGVFANEGKRVNLSPILKIEDSNGKVLLDKMVKKDMDNANQSAEKQSWNGEKPWQPYDNYILPREVTYLISHILLDDGSRATTFGTGSILNVKGQAVSVKTGTTEDKRDNWAIGYTPSYLVAVWVGNNDNTPMSPYLESGTTGAAPIWNKIISYVLKNQKSQWPIKPDNVVFEEICSLSGLLPNNDCPKRGEYFIKGLKPKERDNVWNQKRKIWVFKDSHKQPRPNDHPNPDQLTEEEHLLISDPLQKDVCVDCGL